MKQKILCNIVLALLLSVAVFAEDSIAVKLPKKQIYYGTMVKFDILSPVLICGLNNWQMQHYEVAVNVRLAKRWYPTLELGYTGGKTHNDTVSYKGQGGFFRVGCDVNPLKKRPDSPHALLLGLRIGTAMQQFDQDCEKKVASTLATDQPYINNYVGARADCWGEIVAGCQVEIAKVNNTAFYMGWMGRFKFLFTRTEAEKAPIYIPGYGSRDNTAWGANYYLGWKF